MRHFPEENPSPVLQVDSDGNILYRNPAAGRLLGNRGDIPPDWSCHLGPALEGGEVVAFHVEAGERTWLVNLAPNVEVANLYLTDITALEEAKRDALRNDQRIRTVLSTQHSATLLEDNRKVMLVNEAFCDLFAPGLPPAMLTGTDSRRVLEDTRRLFHDPAAFERRLEGLITSDIRVLDEVLLMADGRVLKRDFVPVHVENRRIGTLWQYRDVTEQHQSEQALMTAKQKAQRSLDERSEFVARLSHEIRTPLNAVAGMLELLAESTRMPKDEEALVRGALSNSRALVSLVTDLLDLSRLEGQAEPAAYVPVAPRQLAAKVCDALALRAAEQGLELVCTVSPEVPSLVETDPERLRRILTNLLDNAVKYTDRGEVGLQVHARTDGDRPTLELVVWDTGVGIPNDQLGVIFQRYGQASGARPGPGLGLYIVRQLTHSLGGRLDVESRPGIGTRFLVALPLQTLRGPEGLDRRLRASLAGLPVAIACPAPSRRARLEAALDALGVQRVELNENPVLVAVDDSAPPLTLSKPEPVLLFLESRRTGATPDTSRSVLLKPYLPDDLGRALLRALDHTDDTPTARRSAKVLVVEDNRVNQHVARHQLESLGMEVRLAEDGPSALEQVRDVDVVLMDLHMRGMDGFDTTRRMLAERPELPIVALTAHSTARFRERSTQAGMQGFLVKPVDNLTLQKVLNETLRPRPSVLIVHPAPEMRRLLERFLSRSKCTVMVVGDIVEAVERIEREQPSLAVLDASMPGQDGRSPVHQLRERGLTHPIIGLTRNTEAASHDALLSEGFDSVLVMPIRRAVLVETVRHWLSRSPTGVV